MRMHVEATSNLNSLPVASSMEGWQRTNALHIVGSRNQVV
jgi:hypothetical protein